MKTVTFKYVNYLGLTKTIEHTPDQIKEMNKIDRKELIKRLQASCNHYAKSGYWTFYYIDGKEVAKAQSADF